MVRAMAVQRAANTQTGFAQDVGVNHGRGDIFVAQELLHRSDVVTTFKKVRSKAMTERVATGSLWYARFSHRNLDGILKVFLLDMMAAHFPGPRIKRRFRGGKNILPTPGALSIWILPPQAERKVDIAGAAAQVFVVEFFHSNEVSLERVLEALR